MARFLKILKKKFFKNFEMRKKMTYLRSLGELFFFFDNGMPFFEKVTYLCRKVNFGVKKLLFPLNSDLKP